MVRIMNYAYYMLYQLITYIQIFFGNVGYYTAYPFYALFNKGHVLRENREIMNQKYMNHTSYSVSYYASGIFYLGYVIFLADIIVFLYVFGVDLSPYIFDMTKASIITNILAFVIPYPIQKKIIDDRKPLDVHLMVNDVYKYIDDFKELNPLYITFHYEIKLS